MGQLVVVMGVSGSGKSTVGAGLAERLGVVFLDADDLHPEANVVKMASGEPLDDDDRWPWLEDVGRWLAERAAAPGGAGGGVTACSALRRRYRDQLRAHAPGTRFVLLHGDRALLERRQAARRGHFMPPSLLDSQLATLEPFGEDEDGVVVDVDQSVEEIVAEAAAALTGTG